MIVGPGLMGSGGGGEVCSDGTGMKLAALRFMNKCKHGRRVITAAGHLFLGQGARLCPHLPAGPI